MIPTQVPDVNTVASRTNDMGLIIALDDNGNAHGSFYWDGGDTDYAIEDGDYTLLTFDVNSVNINFIPLKTNRKNNI